MLSNRQLFLNHVAQTSPAPLMLEIERAAGCYLYDAAGNQYLDLIAGIAVSNAGHSHPAVLEALKEQAEKYMHLMVYGELVQGPQARFATALVSLLPPVLDNVYFTNSGAEATEGALKLAKRYTGRTKIISFKHSYHGSTHGALSVMGDEFFKRKFRPLLPDVYQFAYNSPAAINAIDEHTAAVILEPIQAESGVTAADAAFLQALRTRCTQTGTLLILDEAQTGLGRTGRMFAFEHYHIVPDILLLAKALGGGMPLGAFIASKKVMSTLTENPVLGHITTFGGHPVCCATGLAALGVLQKQNLVAGVEGKGKLFEQLLQHPKIKRQRRAGLMMSLEFESFEQNKAIIDTCIKNGVLTDWFLFAPHCMRIAPPLIITAEQIQAACNIILASIDAA